MTRSNSGEGGMLDPHILTIQTVVDDQVLLRVDVSIRSLGDQNMEVASALLAEIGSIASSLVDASVGILQTRMPNTSSDQPSRQRSQTSRMEPTK